MSGLPKLLRDLCEALAAPDLDPERFARSLGRVEQQAQGVLPYRIVPTDPRLSAAELVLDAETCHLRLTLAEDTPLSALEPVFGPARALPRLPGRPLRLAFVASPGACTPMAELATDGRVHGLTLRRD